MKTSQTGRYYAGVILCYLIIASFLLQLIPLNSSFSSIYSSLISQLSLLLATLTGAFLIFFFNKKRGTPTPYFFFVEKHRIYSVVAYILIPILSLIIVFSFNKFNTLIIYLFNKLGFNNSSIEFCWDTPSKLVITLIITSVIPAITEELFIRGFCLGGLSSGRKPYIAIIISALLFAVMHLNPMQLVYQFMLGLILAFLYKISGSITYSVFLHFCNNAIIIIYTYIKKGEDVFIVDNRFILTASLLALAGLIGVIIILMLFTISVKNKNDLKSKSFNAKNIFDFNSSFAFLRDKMTVTNGDISCSTKAENIIFWCYFSVIGILWIINTIMLK